MSGVNSLSLSKFLKNKKFDAKGGLFMATYTNGDSYDLTTIFPDSFTTVKATDNTGDGHIDSNMFDNGTLTVTSDGYYSTTLLVYSDVNHTTTVTNSNNLTAVIYDSSTSLPVGTSSEANLLASKTYFVQVLDTKDWANHLNGSETWSSPIFYSVKVAPTDGDSYDMTPAINATDTTPGTFIGHTDFAGDYDYGQLTVNSSGYYELKLTTSSDQGSTKNIYDYTDRVYASTNSLGYYYVDATHQNYVEVKGGSSATEYTNYTGTVTWKATGSTPSDTKHSDGDSDDLPGQYIYPSNTASTYSDATNNVGTGHTDSASDVDYGYLAMASSGYYDITLDKAGKDGGANIRIYDATVLSYVGDTTTTHNSYSNQYIDASHANYVEVTGNSDYSAGRVFYAVTANPNASVRDGDATDLTPNKYISPNSGTDSEKTNYGHTDGPGDVDYGYLNLGNMDYYDIVIKLYSDAARTAGNMVASTTALAHGLGVDVAIYDSTTKTRLISGGKYDTNLYINPSDANYVEVTASATETTPYWYSVTLVKNTTGTHDEGTGDMTLSEIIYPYSSDSGKYTATGRVDFAGDKDYGTVDMGGVSGYVNLNPTVNPGIDYFIFDASTGKKLYNSLTGSYTTDVYVDASHTNYLEVDAQSGTTSGIYNVTVQTTQHDGDATDMKTSDYIYPSSPLTNTDKATDNSVSGHTDYKFDLDSGTLVMASSGYYKVNVTTNGALGTNFNVGIYDATDKKYLAYGLVGNVMTFTDVVNASHTNYLDVYALDGSKKNYTLTVTPTSTDGDSTDLTLSKYISASSDATGHVDLKNGVDQGTLALGASGYYDAYIFSGSVTAAIYDVTANTKTWLNSTAGTQYYFEATHTNYLYVVGADGATIGSGYDVKFGTRH